MIKKILIILTILAFPLKINAGFVESGSAASLLKHEVEIDPRVSRLQGFLTDKNSVLSGEAEYLVKEADRVNIDWRLLAAISGLESTYCKFIPANSFNCWGWGIPSGATSGIGFKNYRDAITTISEGLRDRYINRGYITIDQIGSIYAASPTWSIRVKSIIDDINKWQPVAFNTQPQINL